MRPAYPTRPALRYLLIAGALLICSAVRADVAVPPLRAFSAVYAVRVAGITVGELTRRLTFGPDARYRFESTLAPSGLAAMLRAASVNESSEGQFEREGVRPLAYSHQRVSGRKRRELETRFDWTRNEITTHDRGNTVVFAGAPGVLDKLSYQLVLMLDLKRERNAFEYVVADGARLKTYTLSEAGGESIQFEGRAVPARKLVYARAGSQRRTTLWCAAEYDYLPLQIEYREDDSLTLATLKRLD